MSQKSKALIRVKTLIIDAWNIEQRSRCRDCFLESEATLSEGK